MKFGKSHWRSFEQGITKEWLLSNGKGGFSSSTIVGVNTRRYHGLLVAALNPPVSRHLILSKIDETIIIGNRHHDLYSFQTKDFILKGYEKMASVEFDPLPKFTYSIKDIVVEKNISMVYGENTVAVVYNIYNGSEKINFRMTPLINFRDHHSNSKKRYMKFNQKEYNYGSIISPKDKEVNIKLHCKDAQYFKYQDCWFYNMDYAIEKRRGLESVEDHYMPGYFDIAIQPNEHKTITFIATIENDVKLDNGFEILENEKKRLQELVDKAGYEDEFAKRLVRAADSFIVDRNSTKSKTILAGFPWFTDWGRDTMIAFTGITLITKRFCDAKDILFTFSKYIKNGLIPNMFPDEGTKPLYNSVDGALFYFEAVNNYLKYTSDFNFVKEHIYSGLKDIISAFKMGTDFKIEMDKDYLITAGDHTTQLTWMDAKVCDWVVTPRSGKVVEINALWYNALKIMVSLSKEFGEDVAIYKELSIKVKESFLIEFWNEEQQCLYDVVKQEKKDGKIRPNQIMALSLSYPVLDNEYGRKVVETVRKTLYTSYGLRTLSRDCTDYRGIFIGDQYSRDGAYHQGTVWSWLLGHFITAYRRVNEYSIESKRQAEFFIKAFEDHLDEACIGNVSEVFDGDEPSFPRGCFAQAWGVGELLRAYIEDVK